jgi:hypothetical protein
MGSSYGTHLSAFLVTSVCPRAVMWFRTHLSWLLTPHTCLSPPNSSVNPVLGTQWMFEGVLADSQPNYRKPGWVKLEFDDGDTNTFEWCVVRVCNQPCLDHSVDLPVFPSSFFARLLEMDGCCCTVACS